MLKHNLMLVRTILCLGALMCLGGPKCSFASCTSMAGDIDHNCVVDFNDLVIMANNWLQSDVAGDINLDNAGLVDLGDFAIFSQNWLEQTSDSYSSGSIWYLENYYLRIAIDPTAGSITTYDKQAGYTWSQPNALTHKPFTSISANGNQVAFQSQLRKSAGVYVDCNFRLVLPVSSRQLQMYVNTSNANSTFDTLENLEPFSAPNTSNSFIAVADWSCGHIYPSNVAQWPVYSLDNYSVDMLQLPWVGVVDINSGLGYSVTVDTPCDATLKCIMLGSRRAPLIAWRSEKTKISYERCIIYTFTASGGYVQLAKDLRTYMQSKGYLATFAQKVSSRPDVVKLNGAPKLWDYFHYINASLAYNLGVLKGTHFVHKWDESLNKYPTDKNDAAEINRQKGYGWLTEEYQVYADAYACNTSHPDPEPLYDIYPTNFMRDKNNDVILGWADSLGQQYMRCPSFYVQRATEYLPGRLSSYPLNGLYLDVTPVRDLFECYDAVHPKTRRGYLADSSALMSYIAGRPLVLSGETGKWWAVPYLDAPLGLMSVLSNPWLNSYWPSSYHQLDFNGDGTNDTTLAAWDNYETWGSLGHTYRIPLWQLVFHDCTSTDWYPSDSVDVTARAEKNDPSFPFSYQLKKEVLSILYGSAPTFTEIDGANQSGSWTHNRQAFMRTYRNVCKLNEVIGNQELLTHQFLTSDRNVQKTVWSDGTEVVANFGSSDFIASIGDKTYTLKQFGWCAKGPSYDASCSYDSALSKTVTEINQPGQYYFSDSSGISVAQRKIDSLTLRVNGDDPKRGYKLRIYPKKVIADWNMINTTVYYCDNITGVRQGTLPCTINSEYIETPTISGWAVLDVTQ